MKCSQCESEWEWSDTLDEWERARCPFCHALLIKEDLSAKEALHQIISEHGTRILNDAGAVNLLMANLAGRQVDGVHKVRTALAVNTGTEIYALLQERKKFDEQARERVRDFLTECGFTKEFCAEVIGIFSYALKDIDFGKLSRSRKYEEKREERIKSYCEHINEDGSVTKGWRMNGIWNGPFKKEYEEGSYYEGTYVNGRICGQLIYVAQDGSAFIGRWENGGWNGPCRKEEPDGRVVEGSLVDNVWDGPFKQFDSDGCVYEGLYDHGRLVEDSVKIISEKL
ncbi:hypothetical protein [uncultured Dubosiella sp.]|uniref:hypothetical protein n=1 Tax=uncultured Dubosiella sp. TaxID=1937011 RepID=UPI0026224C86|nr:hypothetical protein [uncultured Dubosiella sp.]